MSVSRTGSRTYVGPAFDDARVYDAMRVGVVTCTPDTSLQDAARMMSGYGIHCLVVADPATGRHTVSWRVVDALDVARAEAEGMVRSVGEIASDDVVTIDSEAPLSEAARLMAERRSPHLVAVSAGTDRPVGVPSASGLAAVLAWGSS
jgi:CBS domain-containing protein